MILFFSDIKMYSSESQKPIIIDKSINLIDSLVKSVLNMFKLFDNSEFVSFNDLEISNLNKLVCFYSN